MQFDKQFILEELRKQGKSQHVQNAIQQLPEKIDHEQHAALLEKFGLDPGNSSPRQSSAESARLRAPRRRHPPHPRRPVSRRRRSTG